MKTGDRVGAWTLLHRIGIGGNGEVWQAERARDDRFALKRLRTDRKARDRMARFRREISFLLEHRDYPGVLPLIDYDFPEALDASAWYVMPLAAPMRDALGGDPAPALVVKAIGAVANTLVRLVDEGVAHHDIKPSNLYHNDDEWLLGDFGLVTYPDIEPITKHGRRLGPIDFMAPEMRDSADEADPHAADVYSLAKTLWVLILNVALPLPGPHRLDDPAYSISQRLAYTRAAELDRLLEAATRHDPAERIPVSLLADELSALLDTPPERVEIPDVGDLVQRIEALTVSTRRSAEAEGDFRQACNTAFYRLKDEALSPTYHQLARCLPGFRSTYNTDLALLARLPPRHSLFAQYGWAGHISYPLIGGPLIVSIAVGVRVIDRDHADIIGSIRIQKSHPVASDATDPYFEHLEVMPRSASETNAIETIKKGLASAVPETLKLVAAAIANQE